MEYLALQCFENVQIFHIFLTFRAQIPFAKSGGQEAVSSSFVRGDKLHRRARDHTAGRIVIHIATHLCHLRPLRIQRGVCGHGIGIKNPRIGAFGFLVPTAEGYAVCVPLIELRG